MAGYSVWLSFFSSRETHIPFLRRWHERWIGNPLLLVQSIFRSDKTRARDVSSRRYTKRNKYNCLGYKEEANKKNACRYASRKPWIERMKRRECRKWQCEGSPFDVRGGSFEFSFIGVDEKTTTTKLSSAFSPRENDDLLFIYIYCWRCLINIIAHLCERYRTEKKIWLH